MDHINTEEIGWREWILSYTADWYHHFVIWQYLFILKMNTLYNSVIPFLIILEEIVILEEDSKNE